MAGIIVLSSLALGPQHSLGDTEIPLRAQPLQVMAKGPAAGTRTSGTPLSLRDAISGMLTRDRRADFRQRARTRPAGALRSLTW